MTFTVEDGTGLASANSYCSAADADAYHATRLYSEPWVTDYDVKLTALVWATRLLDEQYEWKGLPTTTTQALGWPRSGAYTRNGVALSSSAVPTAVRDATAELARWLILSDRSAASDERDVVSKSVSNGSTSLTYGSLSETAKVVPMPVWQMVSQVVAPARVVRQ